MRYIYLNASGSSKTAYEGVASLRTDHGLVRVMRRANEDDREYHSFDPFVTIAVIRLGDGERIVGD